MPKRDYASSGATGPRQGSKKKVKRTYTGSAASAAWRASPAYMGLNRRAVASKESGYVDLISASYNFDTTGSIALIATIQQGTSVQQRIGKKVVLKSLQMRGFAQAGSTATINDVAMLIVYDARPTGSLPAITDILNSANSRSFNNDANSGRFKILKRVDCVLVGGATLTEATYKDMDFYLDLKKRPCVFQAAGSGAIGDISEGALYVVTVGSNAAGTTAASMVAGFRTRFIDV